MRIARLLVALSLLGCPLLSQDSQPNESPLVASSIAQSNLISYVQPEYPPLAKLAAIAGKVRAETVIDKVGNVANVKLLSGHPMLAPAAIAAIRKWKYKPFELDGTPTEIRIDVEVSIPAKLDEDEQAREDKFQKVFWPNERAGDEALKKDDLETAESKLQIARSAAEERGDKKWLELSGVITSLGAISFKKNKLDDAERLYKEALALHEKHQRPDEAEVAGAQQNLAFLYFRRGRLDDAEPLYRTSVKTYEACFKDIGMPEAKAAYGRHLALGHFALAQIAVSSQQQAAAHEECEKAVSYAEQWSDPENRKVIETACAATHSE